jgi:tetratricopeptide (TPR) repeat protein
LLILASFTNVVAQNDNSILIGKNVNDWHAIAAALISEGNYEESIKYYDRILEINPEDQKALLNNGSVLIELDRFEEAIKYYDRILEINPKNVKALASKGIALSHLEKYDEAIVVLNKALLIEPDNGIIKKKKANFLSGAATISAHDSIYDIKFRITIKDSSGYLVSVSESTNTRYLPYKITEEVFESGFDSKEVVTIDGKSYQKVNKIDGVTTLSDRSGMFSVTIERDGSVIDIFQAFTPMIIIEDDDNVTIEWRILKEIT